MSSLAPRVCPRAGARDRFSFSEEQSVRPSVRCQTKAKFIQSAADDAKARIGLKSEEVETDSTGDDVAPKKGARVRW